MMMATMSTPIVPSGVSSSSKSLSSGGSTGSRIDRSFFSSLPMSCICMCYSYCDLLHHIRLSMCSKVLGYVSSTRMKECHPHSLVLDLHRTLNSFIKDIRGEKQAHHNVLPVSIQRAIDDYILSQEQHQGPMYRGVQQSFINYFCRYYPSSIRWGQENQTSKYRLSDFEFDNNHGVDPVWCNHVRSLELKQFDPRVMKCFPHITSLSMPIDPDSSPVSSTLVHYEYHEHNDGIESDLCALPSTLPSLEYYSPKHVTNPIDIKLINKFTSLTSININHLHGEALLTIVKNNPGLIHLGQLTFVPNTRILPTRFVDIKTIQKLSTLRYLTSIAVDNSWIYCPDYLTTLDQAVPQLKSLEMILEDHIPPTLSPSIFSSLTSLNSCCTFGTSRYSGLHVSSMESFERLRSLPWLSRYLPTITLTARCRPKPRPKTATAPGSGLVPVSGVTNPNASFFDELTIEHMSSFPSLTRISFSQYPHVMNCSISFIPGYHIPQWPPQLTTFRIPIEIPLFHHLINNVIGHTNMSMNRIEVECTTIEIIKKCITLGVIPSCIRYRHHPIPDSVRDELHDIGVTLLSKRSQKVRSFRGYVESVMKPSEE